MRSIALPGFALLVACERAAPPCPVCPPPAVVPPDAAAAKPSRLDQLRDFVRLGYGDAHDLEVGALSFRTDAISTAELKVLVAEIGNYNAFDGAKVAAALDQLAGEIMYYELGREASPVIYVELPYWLKQQEKNCPDQRCGEGAWGEVENDRRLTPAEHAALVARVKEVFTGVSADRVTVSDHRVRVWWD